MKNNILLLLVPVVVWIAGSPFHIQATQAPFVFETNLEAYQYHWPNLVGSPNAPSKLVDISGDTLVVGSPGEDSHASGVNGDEGNIGAPDSGAAYVYLHEGDQWVRQAYLKPSNTDAGDLFGFSVAISGDLLVVGAPFEDSLSTTINWDPSNNASSASGAVYVFARSGTNWIQEAYIKAPNGDPGDQFGVSVDISGNRIVVGALNERSLATGVNGDMKDNTGGNTGAAYVFSRSDTGEWQFEAYLKRIDQGIRFGTSCSIDGDRIVVGAPGFRISAAVVFDRDEGGWHPAAELQGHNTTSGPGDRLFGWSVDVSGDTVVVGDWWDITSGTGVNPTGSSVIASQSGAVYVFVREEGQWSQHDFLKAFNSEGDIYFGFSVSLDGDLLAVGAQNQYAGGPGVYGVPFVTEGSIGIGAVHTFLRTGNTWKQTAFIKPTQINHVEFGASVVVSNGQLAISSQEASSGLLYLYDGLLPELEVVWNSGEYVLDGSLQNLASINGSHPSTTVTLENHGEDVLSELRIELSGADANQFMVSGQIGQDTQLHPGERVSFTLQFIPTDPSEKRAVLVIHNNDVDENPFEMILRGLTLSKEQDLDGDGLSDAEEFHLAKAGFDWELSQPLMVQALRGYLSFSELYSLSQIQTLNVESPLLAKDLQTGNMVLTIGLEKSRRLNEFDLLPLTQPQVKINLTGKLEIQISPQAGTEFYRLESH